MCVLGGDHQFDKVVFFGSPGQCHANLGVATLKHPNRRVRIAAEAGLLAHSTHHSPFFLFGKQHHQRGSQPTSNTTTPLRPLPNTFATRSHPHMDPRPISQATRSVRSQRDRLHEISWILATELEIRKNGKSSLLSEKIEKTSLFYHKIF